MYFQNGEEERSSAKERLRVERQSEYNQFLKLKTEATWAGLSFSSSSSKEYTELMGAEVESDTHGMSLDIGERLSPKAKLRFERQTEYNQFLRLKTEGEEERHRLAQVASEEYTQKAQNLVKHEQFSAQVYPRNEDFTEKDAYNSMEAYNPNRPRDNKQRPDAAEMGSIGLFSEEKPRRDRQAAQSYQEELERQIRGNTEKRRQDKEDHVRYEAKLHAEMKDYNPWGKSGGGAPLTDAKGKPVTHLQRMHKQNEDAELKALDDQLAVMDLSLAGSTTSGKIAAGVSEGAGFSQTNPPKFGRNSMFTEPRSEHKVQQQESYKDYLRQQIEEKRHRETGERERNRLEDESEQQYLAGQRANIQREHEEEQSKKKLEEEEEEDILKMYGTPVM